MRLKKDGSYIFSKSDTFHRELYCFSDKLLDSSVNKWFRLYADEHNICDYEQARRDITDYMINTRGYSESAIKTVMIMTLTDNVAGDRRKYKYTVTDDDGNKIKFDMFNGFWYTASEIGKDAHMVLFDKGEFYCMRDIFPLADYLIKMSREMQSNE